MVKIDKVVLVTGGFDPVHSGHVQYIREANSLGQILVVGLNSDEWLTRKKGQPFMSFDERKSILEEFDSVYEVIDYDDTDNSSKNAIIKVRQMYPDAKIIFANGGDRTQENIPEMDIDDDNIEFIFGVGGAFKKNSSSWILREWKEPKTVRPWGHYRVLYDMKGCKVKELVVEPNQSLSMQKHNERSELWFVSEGRCKVDFDTGIPMYLTAHTDTKVFRTQWHRLYNPYDKPCKLIEIQYGTECTETDIERK